MALNSRCWLVVASACSTGEGRPTSGNDVLGISRGLLGCGASGAVVSLWPVDDEQTADLMIAFYERLLRGAPPADALCAAQRDSLIGGAGRVGTAQRDLGAPLDVKTPAPLQMGPERWWAPFVLSGRDALRTSLTSSPPAPTFQNRARAPTVLARTTRRAVTADVQASAGSIVPLLFPISALRLRRFGLIKSSKERKRVK